MQVYKKNGRRYNEIVNVDVRTGTNLINCPQKLRFCGVLTTLS